MGWRGAARHWQRYQSAYLLLGGLAAPLVVSVHSVVGMDFAAGIVPGWHTTIFPPYFVAGAIFSGFAMVLTLGIPLRWVYGLAGLDHHPAHRQLRQADAGHRPDRRLRLRIRIVHGLVQRRRLRIVHNLNRVFGPYAWSWWTDHVLQRASRRSFSGSARFGKTCPLMFLISLIIQIGMWTERFVIVITSLHRDFVPSLLGHVLPDVLGLDDACSGTIGFFLMAFFHVRAIPAGDQHGGNARAGSYHRRRRAPGQVVHPVLCQMTRWKRTLIHGMLAEFDSEEAVLEAAHKTRAAGYQRVEGYTPFAVEGLAEALGSSRTRLASITFFFGILGACLASGCAGMPMSSAIAGISAAGRPTVGRRLFRLRSS